MSTAIAVLTLLSVATALAASLDRYGHVSDTMKKQSSELLESLIEKL